MEGREMTAPEVMRELEIRGFTIVGGSVDWALKRAEKLGHLIRVRRGVWAYNQNSGDTADIPEGDHAMKTRAGLVRAKERGVRLGPPPKLTDEHRLLAKSLFERGATLAEIAKACGVSPGGIGRRIKEWREEGQFPERKRGRRKETKSESEERDRGALFH
jgi:hypothetical protein